MSRQEEDWVVPATGEWESLWTCFHDAVVRDLAHDPMARTLDLRLEVGFPAPPTPFPSEITVKFQGVTHVLIYSSSDWPGPAPVHQSEMTHEIWEEMIRRYRDKGYITTLAVGAFVDSLSRQTNEILLARWSQTAENVTLEVEGTPDFRLTITAKELSIEAGAGKLSMAELLQIGESGWDAWQSRNGQA